MTRRLEGYDTHGRWQVIDLPEPAYFWLGADAGEPSASGAVVWLSASDFGRGLRLSRGLPGPA